MNQEELKLKIATMISKRDYFSAFQLINQESEEYLKSSIISYEFCIELIKQNQDLFEFMGASKQFEMAFDLLNTLTKNRNRLFIRCLAENQKELIPIFKRCVGDISSDY